MPPATTHCASAALIAWAASITALSPEPHTLLMVSAGTVPGRPAWIAAWRAGAWPTPPWSTLPMITSSTAAGSTPARRTASRITSAPKRGAGSVDRPPRYLPTGVRQADRITGVVSSLVLIRPSFPPRTCVRGEFAAVLSDPGRKPGDQARGPRPGLTIQLTGPVSGGESP